MILNFTDLSSEHTKRLNQIARNIARSYTEFIDECCKKYGSDYLFWATPLASRNIFNDSDTFLSICRVLLAVECIKDQKIDQIITEYESEREVLRKCVNQCIAVDSLEKSSAWKKFRKKVFDLTYVLRFYRYEVTCLKHSKRFPLPSYDEPISLVVMQVSVEDFDGLFFNDRLFTGIREYKDVIVYADCLINPKYSAKEYIDKLECCKNYPFLNRYHFLQRKDFLELIRYWKVVKRIEHDFYIFKNIDVSPIIFRCLNGGRTNITSLKGLLERQIIARMKETAIPIKDCIIWYEGRPSDVMMSSAIRKYYPKANCVGYEGYPLIEINLATFISDFQYRSRFSPSIMAIPSNTYEREAHQFCQTIPLLYVPILRNKYVICSKTSKSVEKQMTIMVLLPYFVDGAKELLAGVDWFIRTKTEDYRIIIKNHPRYLGFKAKDYGFSQLSFTPEYVEGRLEDCLDGVDAVVTSMTTSGLEIICADVPLVMVCPHGKLGFVALPKELDRKMFYEVFDQMELMRALDECFQEKDPNNILLGKMITPITIDSIGQMFK